MTHEEMWAATLAACCFWMLMALVAAFGLNILQYNALNTFINSLLDELVYVEMASGHTLPGKVFQLICTLYGLWWSPCLWQLEFTCTLCKLGLTPVPKEPCLFVGCGIVLLVYMDDILIIFYLDYKDDTYECCNHELQLWVLQSWVTTISCNHKL